MKAVWLGREECGIILTVENNQGTLKGMQRKNVFEIAKFLSSMKWEVHKI